MKTIDVNPTIDRGDRHSIVLRAVVRRIEGVHSSYGPGGFGIGIVPSGSSARRVTGGELVAGPWGYFFGRASVLDNYGGTAAELARLRDAGLLVDVVADGDVLRIGADEYVVRVRADGASLERVR